MCISDFISVAIAGLLAQLAGTAAIRTMEMCSIVNIHTTMCREWGAAQVFCVSTLQACFQYQPGLVALLLSIFLASNVQFMYFDWMLWAPIAKRPSALPQPSSKRPRQQQVDYGPWCNDLARSRGESAVTSHKGRCETERRREENEELCY